MGWVVGDVCMGGWGECVWVYQVPTEQLDLVLAEHLVQIRRRQLGALAEAGHLGREGRERPRGRGKGGDWVRERPRGRQLGTLAEAGHLEGEAHGEGIG